MKTIKVKQLTKLISEDIKVGDETSAKKLKKRVIDLIRTAKEARAAAKEATKNNQPDLADALNKRADELDELVKNSNADTLDDEENPSNSSDSSNGKESDEEQDGDKAGKEQGDEEGEGEEEQQGNQDQEGNDEGSKSQNDDWMDPDADTDSVNDSDSDSNSQQTNSKKSKKNKNSKDGEDDDGDEGEDQNDGDGDDDSEGDESDQNSKNKNKSKGSKSQSGSQGDDSDDEGDENSEGGDGDQGNKNQDQDQDQNSNSNSKKPPVKDPFANEEDIPQFPMGGQGGQQPQDATIDDIIKQLKGLTGEAKKGAIAGLGDLIKNGRPKKESLTEATKGLREISDDEYNALINDTLDMIEKAKKVSYIDDLSKRKQRVSRWSQSPTVLKDLEIEDNVNTNKDYQAKKAREKEKEKYSHFATIEEFTINFYNAIKDQVEMVRQEYQSYDEINPEYEDEDIIMKADLVKELPSEAIPTINVYFDQSGSWDESDIEVGKKAISTIKKFEDNGEIKLNILYFANHVHRSAAHARAEGGTSAWEEILDNIQATGANNVVIMTDSDMDGQGYYSSQVRVDGCVWWIWRDDKSAQNCAKKLIGRQENFQCSFRSW